MGSSDILSPFKTVLSNMSKKFTQKEFLEKVHKNNKNDIDYSRFVYDGNNKPSLCKCNVCGHEWKPIPMSLFKGHGCPKCAIEHKARKLSKKQEKLIEEFKKVHGDKYIYDLVKYKNEKTEVEIICPKHGVFKQRPLNHLNGRGCHKCADSGIKLTQEEFEIRMKEKFPSIDFSSFKYVNCETSSKCKCLICGHEWYTNYKLLKNSKIGCPKCALKSRSDKRRDTLETFLKKYNEKFPNNEFDFSKSVYISALVDMDVICHIHGKFKIRPNDLMNGHGCPKCYSSKLENDIQKVLKENSIEYIERKSHSWLLNEDTNHKLTLDFFLPKQNIAIECQGEQHFISIEHFGGDEKFEKRIKYDKLKKELCSRNGVKLIYYLDEEYNKYMKNDDVYFNNIDDLISYIKGYGNT